MVACLCLWLIYLRGEKKMKNKKKKAKFGVVFLVIVVPVFVFFWFWTTGRSCHDNFVNVEHGHGCLAGVRNGPIFGQVEIEDAFLRYVKHFRVRLDVKAMGRFALLMSCVQLRENFR